MRAHPGAIVAAVPEGQVCHRNAMRFWAARSPAGALTRVEAPEPRLAGQRIPERLAGDAVTAAEAVGKHHLLRFASGRVLHSHLMMRGVWRLLPAARAPRPGGLFLALWTADHVAALYRCPDVRLLEPGEPLPRRLPRERPGPARRRGRARDALRPRPWRASSRPARWARR